MKKIIKNWPVWMMLFLGCMLMTTSCKKTNQNDLPGISPGDFDNKIDGYDSSEQIYTSNLIAYWSFDDTKAEKKSGVTPTASVNDTYVTGVRGKAVNLNSGYLYYATQIPAFNADLQSWTVSEWVQLLNNGTTPTSVFQLTRPGQLYGYINSLVETGANPASELNKVVIKSLFADQEGGLQDNLNASWLAGFKSPKTGPDKWIHIVTTYDRSANNLQIWADGEMIGATDYQNRGSKYFKPAQPNAVIIGGWYNNIPGMGVTADTWTVPMKGKVDEIRVYNTILGPAHIKALYKLGVAGK